MRSALTSVKNIPDPYTYTVEESSFQPVHRPSTVRLTELFLCFTGNFRQRQGFPALKSCFFQADEQASNRLARLFLVLIILLTGLSTVTISADIIKSVHRLLVFVSVRGPVLYCWILFGSVAYRGKICTTGRPTASWTEKEWENGVT